MTDFADIPGVAAPARRALHSAGYADVESLAGADYSELSQLHGVGARSLERLVAALAERGLSFSGHVPEPADRRATRTVVPTAHNADAGATSTRAAQSGSKAPGSKVPGSKGSAAKGKSENLTQPGSVDQAQEYLSNLEPRRKAHGAILASVFEEATGQPGVLWGKTMIGYGQVHYVYATGREGDTFRVGFAPRKAKLSIYGIQATPTWEQRHGELGKFTTGVSCVYINKPEDVDLEVLKDLIRAAWQADNE